MVNEQKYQNHITLWADFRKGDRQAFEALLSQYYAMLLAYGIRLMADKTIVEDCLQDFFVELWQKRDGLGDAKSIKAYLIASFRRRLFREKEKQNRMRITKDVSDDYDFDIEFDIETTLISKERDDENAKKLKYYINNLSKRQKEAIFLRFYQALEYPDIAQIMGINQHSAVNLIYDALKILRKSWDKMMILVFICFFLKNN